jgi:hypothetical protein
MKKKMTLGFFLLLLSYTLSAQTTTFTGTGNWTDPARWDNGVPGTEVTNLTVIIEGTCTLSSEIDIENTAVLRIANGGTLIIDGDDDNSPELDINGGMLIIESGGELNQPRSFVRISQSINNDVVIAGTYNHTGGNLAFQDQSENMVINGGSYICTGGTSKFREVIVNGSGTFSNAITLSTKDITLNGSAQLVNTGTINFTANDFLTLNDDAVLTNNGIINLNQQDDFLQNAAGTRIQGSGTFNLSEPFFNNGTIAPGNSIGDITFNGNLTIAAGSSLEIEITGTSGDSDVLIINGDLTIENPGATLDVSLISGTLDMGDNYDIITWNSVSGIFSTVNLPGITTDWDKPTYGAGALNIEYISSDPLLPIELLSFRGEQVEDAVQLSWSTASELNNDYMLIERSADGLDFNEIGRIKGKGTTLEPQQYGFTDHFPLQGWNYYRLIQVDYDGSMEYHPVIVVKVAEGEQLKLNVYPNPVVSDDLRIQWATPKGQKARLSLLDESGRLLSERFLGEGSGIYVLSVDQLQPGIYVLQLGEGKERRAHRFIKK